MYKYTILPLDPPSVKLVELLPRKMIIPSGVLQVLNTTGQGQWETWPSANKVKLFFTFYILGEFSSVFKAHLKWHRSAETNVVAVKTMKGTSYTNTCVQSTRYIH